jgi:hypothetical protein
VSPSAIFNNSASLISICNKPKPPPRAVDKQHAKEGCTAGDGGKSYFCFRVLNHCQWCVLHRIAQSALLKSICYGLHEADMLRRVSGYQRPISRNCTPTPPGVPGGCVFVAIFTICGLSELSGIFVSEFI